MAIDTIGTNAIANDAVTAAKIPAGAVDADITAIPDGSVTTVKLADDAITGAKLANNIGALRNIQRFTSSGTYTPTSGTKHIHVIITGGGASGGSYNTTPNANTVFHAGGGGAGGTRFGYLQGIDASSYTATITIGAGGAGAQASNGGGDSTYNDGTRTLVGSGGAVSIRDSNTVVGGTRGGNGGGTSSTGTWTLSYGHSGGPGGNGFGVQESVGVIGGEGGTSFWGGGGCGEAISSTQTRAGTNAPGNNDGAGGGAAVGHRASGSIMDKVAGHGNDGVCVIYEYV